MDQEMQEDTTSAVKVAVEALKLLIEQDRANPKVEVKIDKHA